MHPILRNAKDLAMPRTHLWLTLLVAFVAFPALSTAQPNVFAPAGNGLGNNNFLQGNNIGQGNQQGGQQGGNNGGFPGGAANADFDSLIDLITSTVSVDSWQTNGGVAEVRPFPGGVWVDPAGSLREHQSKPSSRLVSLERPIAPAAIEADNPRKLAKLRCVSLPRLEAEIYRGVTSGQRLDEAMMVLAGLRRVQYVFLYPEIGDVVLAGPAGDWRLDAEHRLVATDDGTPIVRLDDLLTLLRRERAEQHKPFGCSITPRQARLAATQAVLDRSASEPLAPGRKARERWLEEIRETLGEQDITVFGLQADTHAAHVLVKADYHMKRIGIGLEDSVPGVDSYLQTVAQQADPPNPLSVLRWWFSTNYTGIAGSDAGTAFEFLGQGVCVLSENEMLTKRGERVHTGQSDEATQQFAHQFTAEFAALSAKYPVYGELRNLFDLALVAALLDGDDLYATAGWQPVLFLNAEHLPLPTYHPPKTVETIANHRLKGEGQILAAVSGGVWIDSQGVLAKRANASDKLDYHRQRQPDDLPAGTWWWDLE